MVQVRPVQEGSYQRFFMKVCKDERHYTEITYDPLTNVLSLDRTHSGCRRDIVHERKCLVRDRQGELKLRVVLDRFSVEVFVNDGEQALTAAMILAGRQDLPLHAWDRPGRRGKYVW